MAGLLGTALGWDKNTGMAGGLYNAFDSNRNAIGSLSRAVGGQTDATGVLGALAGGAFQGSLVDQQVARDKKAVNATLTFLQSKDPELAGLVESGAIAPGDAYKIFTSNDKSKPIEVGGVLLDPVTYKPIFDSRTSAPQQPWSVSAGETLVDPVTRQPIYTGAPKTPDVPSGYQMNPAGGLAFIPGGPADPANMGKTTEAQRRNQQLASVIQPELQAVEQNWNELSNPQNQAAGMVPGLGNVGTSEGYQKARNAITTIAQSYLYSVSGAAAPAEEVNKLVDSVTPKPFESAASISEKKRRLKQYADAVIIAGSGLPAQPTQAQPQVDYKSRYGLD